ncbi:MAG: hypothetical protein QW815_08600 [Nitrososphaerota archaeon]
MPYRLNWAIAVLIGLAYFMLFAYLSGGIQYFELAGVDTAAPSVVFVYYESQSYTGPGLQLFYGGSMISVRILVVLLGGLLAFLVSLNMLMLFRLWILGHLKSCLVRGSGTGLAVLLSSIASATYTCCGWAPTVAILGVSLASSLGLVPALVSAVLLAFNAVILRKRLSSTQLVPPSQR